jgi:hypothetical protein
MKDDLARIWEEAVVAQSRYDLGNCVKRLRETMKTSVRLADVPAEIRNKHFPNMSQVS